MNRRELFAALAAVGVTGLAMRPDDTSARFSSLNTSAKDRIDVNQILGSVDFGLQSPRAMDNIRSRIFSCDKIPTTIVFMTS